MAIAIAVEGPTGRAVAEKILICRSLCIDRHKIIVTRGKAALDRKIVSYNAAARRSPWFVLRDADRDEGDCVVRTRHGRLSLERQSPAMCFRLAVLSVEAWLLADRESLAATFSVSLSAVPTEPETLLDPKTTLVNLCRKSRKRDVRRGMVPPERSPRKIGDEYPTFVIDYCREAWRPDVAAQNAPSLSRALKRIDELVSSGIWS